MSVRVTGSRFRGCRSASGLINKHFNYSGPRHAALHGWKMFSAAADPAWSFQIERVFITSVALSLASVIFNSKLSTLLRGFGKKGPLVRRRPFTFYSACCSVSVKGLVFLLSPFCLGIKNPVNRFQIWSISREVHSSSDKTWFWGSVPTFQRIYVRCGLNTQVLLFRKHKSGSTSTHFTDIELNSVTLTEHHAHHTFCKIFA